MAGQIARGTGRGDLHQRAVQPRPSPAWPVRRPVPALVHVPDDDNGRPYVEALGRTLRFKYDWADALGTLPSPRNVVRAARALPRTRAPAGSRPLLKDPIAVFSAAWLARTFGMRVVLSVRHPAAFAASLKRLDWTFDFNQLLAQPLLMRDLLEPFGEQLERCGGAPAGHHRPGGALVDGDLWQRRRRGLGDGAPGGSGRGTRGRARGPLCPARTAVEQQRRRSAWRPPPARTIPPKRPPAAPIPRDVTAAPVSTPGGGGWTPPRSRGYAS